MRIQIIYLLVSTSNAIWQLERNILFECTNNQFLVFSLPEGMLMLRTIWIVFFYFSFMDLQISAETHADSVFMEVCKALEQLE